MAISQGKIVFSKDGGAHQSIAISMDVMRASKKAILAAHGAKKAEAVAAALSGKYDYSCPAGLLYTNSAHNSVTWFVDGAAYSSV